MMSFSLRKLFSGLMQRLGSSQQVPSCPQCGGLLAKTPTRKASCPHCDTTIIVRTQNRKPLLLTPSQAAKLDAGRKDKAYENKLLELLEIADSAADDMPARELYKKALSTMPPADAAWSALNQVASRYVQERDFHSAASCYHAMIFLRLLHDEDPVAELAERTTLQILDAQSSGYKKVKVWTGCSCLACSRVKGKTQSILTALKKPLLPVHDCETGTVIFHYRGVV
jgi:hypothetical protein